MEYFADLKDRQFKRLDYFVTGGFHGIFRPFFSLENGTLTVFSKSPPFLFLNKKPLKSTKNEFKASVNICLISFDHVSIN